MNEWRIKDGGGMWGCPDPGKEWVMKGTEEECQEWLKVNQERIGSMCNRYYLYAPDGRVNPPSKEEEKFNEERKKFWADLAKNKTN